MKFNFDWNCVAAGAPYITISELALGFNLPSISLLGNPEEVVVGFDEKTMTIGVKQYDGTENVKSYKEFAPFRQKVLEVAEREINELTDINISYETIKKGTKVVKINFSIKLKSPIDRAIAGTTACDRLNNTASN